MHHESTVSFHPDSRIHLGLAVKNLDQSVAFYRLLFGREPSKQRPGYARFEVHDPAVNLSLNQASGETNPNNPVAHFGIQVKLTEAVRNAADRLEQGGLPLRLEQSVTCCYAVQNKVWVTDPDGNPWEVYVVVDDQAADRQSSASECCPPPTIQPAATQHGPAAQLAPRIGGAHCCGATGN